MVLAAPRGPLGAWRVDPGHSLIRARAASAMLCDAFSGPPMGFQAFIAAKATRCGRGRGLGLAEVGDSLEVRHQASGQPHQLNVALCLAFEAATGLDAIKVAEM